MIHNATSLLTACGQEGVNNNESNDKNFNNNTLKLLALDDLIWQKNMQCTETPHFIFFAGVKTKIVHTLLQIRSPHDWSVLAPQQKNEIG